MNFYDSTPTQVYEVIGANQSWILCHATSPAAAIAQFEASHPDEFFEIKAFVPREARTPEGDRVTVLRSRHIAGELHHEIEPHTWMNDRDLVFTQGATAA